MQQQQSQQQPNKKTRLLSLGLGLLAGSFLGILCSDKTIAGNVAFGQTFDTRQPAPSAISKPSVNKPTGLSRMSALRKPPQSFSPNGALNRYASTAKPPAITKARPENEPENVLILLDSSYSMKEPLQDGRVRMDAAKDAILSVLDRLPPNVRVGLRIYGQGGNAFTTCSSTKLLVPINSNTRQAIASKLPQVRPTGATPISFSIKQALKEDFVGLPGKRTIILVSDGAETCDEDPCTLAVDLIRGGQQIKIDVVSVGEQEPDAVRQLKCIALSTYGQYHNARTAAELVDHMGRSLNVETNVEGKILLPGF